MKVSIFGACIRTELWQDLYAALTKNDIAFEVSFVGPKAPSFPLPENFKFIQSNVKPVQAVELARLQCDGDYFLNTADDLLLPSGALDRMANEYEKSLDKQIIIGTRHSLDDYLQPYNGLRYDITDEASPLLAVGNFMSKELTSAVGGLDRNFIALYADQDIILRTYALGGKVIILNDVIVTELRHKEAGISLSTKYVWKDREYLHQLWGNGKAFKRTSPVEAFTLDNLSTINQGRV